VFEEVEEEDEVKRPELFILNNSKCVCTDAERIPYPGRRRVGSLPHSCKFRGLNASARVVMVSRRV